MSRRHLAMRLERIESNFTALAQALGRREEPAATIAPSLTHRASAPRTAVLDHTPSLITEWSTSSDGLLSVASDQSRYSNSDLWRSLGKEIAEMRDLLDDDNFHECNQKPRQAVPSRPAEPSMFPFANAHSEDSLFPPSQLETEWLWAAYESNVAPLVRIFHLPSLRLQYRDWASDNHQRDSRTRSMMCAVQFAAFVSMSTEECQTKFCETKAKLIHRYRSAVEEAFNQTGLFNTTSVVVLQAFVLYLTVLRRCDDSWLVLSWTGVAIRIALSLGLHRDGLEVGLDGFSIELRRRLWWHLVLLDADLSEAHGVDSLLNSLQSDTRIPSNVNDIDMQADLGTKVDARKSFTDMTPSIVRYEIMLAKRTILLRNQKSMTAEHRTTVMQTMQDKLKEVEKLQNSLEDQFLHDCFGSPSIVWATRQFVQVNCQMMRFCVYHIFGLGAPSDSSKRHDTVRENLLTIAVEVVDKVRDLESNPKTDQWGWYFRSDTQWPALVYLLHEVINKPKSPLIEHAWAVISNARKQYHAGRLPEPGGTSRTRGMLFRPMKELTAKAFLLMENENQQQISRPLLPAMQVESSYLQEQPNLHNDVALLANSYDGASLWSSDQWSAFQDFWGTDGADVTALDPNNSHAAVFEQGQVFEDMLL